MAVSGARRDAFCADAQRWDGDRAGAPVQRRVRAKLRDRGQGDYSAPHPRSVPRQRGDTQTLLQAAIVDRLQFSGLPCDVEVLAHPVRGILAGPEPEAIVAEEGSYRLGQRLDRALRARPRDPALFGLVVRHLTGGLVDGSLWGAIDDAGAALVPLEQAARKLAESYVVVDASPPKDAPEGAGTAKTDRIAFVDATSMHGKYDKTLLLLLGQERAKVAIVLDLDTLTLAAPFDSKVSFLSLLGLSGGMPTLVSVQKDRLDEVWRLLGVAAADAPT